MVSKEKLAFRVQKVTRVIKVFVERRVRKVHQDLLA
jgi:hypothetical protein